MSGEQFDIIANALNDHALEQCVIREEFLNNLGIQANELAAATSRSVTRTFEVHRATIENVGLKDYVWVFAPKNDEDA